MSLARLQAQLTPQRKRRGLYLLLAAALYSLLGFLAAPLLVEKLLKDFVRDELKLVAQVEKIELNPWRLAVRLDGLKISEPQGEALVAARSIYVNASLLGSIGIFGASLQELDLLEPYVNARLNKDGQLNLLQLVPPEDPEDKGEATWKLGLLAIHKGHIDFRDDSRPTPFQAVFEPLNIALENLSSQPDKDGGYALAAETGDQEKLRWRGSVALKPLRSQGQLEITDLKATTLWRYAQDQLPVVVKNGRIDISGEYQLTVDQTVDFKLAKGQLAVDDLALEQRGQDPLLLNLAALKLQDIKLEWPLQTATVQALSLQGLALLPKAGSPALFEFKSLGLNDIRWQQPQETATVSDIRLSELALRDAQAQPLLTLPAVGLQSLQLALAKQDIQLGKILLQDGEAQLQLLPGDQVNWLNALEDLSPRLARFAPPADPKAAATPGKPWTYALGELDLSRFKLNAEDRRFSPAVSIPLQDINMRIHPHQEADQPHELEGGFVLAKGGQVSLKGKLNEAPLMVDSQLSITGIKLPPLAPYFADIGRFDLESGDLDVSGRLQFRQEPKTQASFEGSVSANNFAADDLVLNERFLAWKQLAATGVKWQLDPMRVSVREVRAEQPFGRLVITPDYTLNLQHIFTAAGNNEKAQAKPAAPQAKNGDDLMPVTVDHIQVNRGSMLFADLTLKPQFATGIQNLNGDIRGISTAKNAHAKLELKGTVDQYGKALITGEVNPQAGDRYTDLKVKFDNLELTTLTPYSAKFAGYRIDKGKLSMDLNYQIRDRKLDAKNKVVFNQLALGEKVDSPDAVSLPLRLAVALLKDSNGVIDIDLPVSGSLDDPQFRVAPLVWKALLNVLTKVATAPFKFIAGLVGGGEDMDSIAFAAGSSELAPAEAEKLGKLVGALQKREQLRLELRGSYDSKVDEYGLKARKFDAAYQKQSGGRTDKQRRVLEAMFREKAGREALAQLRAMNLKPEESKEALALAEENYLKALREELIAREVVTDGELRQLALERAKNMRAELVEKGGLNDGRLFVLEPQAISGSAEQVVCKLLLTAS